MRRALSRVLLAWFFISIAPGGASSIQGPFSNEGQCVFIRTWMGAMRPVSSCWEYVEAAKNRRMP